MPGEEIVPRWEWRTFGSWFGAPAEAVFAAMTPTGVQESDELYLLSHGKANVKVRFDLLDVKLLVETNSDGLEQWRPIMKASFPMAIDELSHLFDAIGSGLPALERESYTLEQFLAELAPQADLRPVQVHKRRVRYVVGGCTSEVSEVDANDDRIRTVAIESEDPAAVVAAVRSVGLGDYLNINYTRGLHAAIDHVPARYATIDVGTNSVKFHLAERSDDGAFTRLVDRAEVTRLGEGLAVDGSIQREPTERTASAIAGMADEAREHEALAIAAVGTAGLRMAGNSADVLAAIKARSRVSVEIISGEDESRLAYLAARSSLVVGDGPIVVFDTGGGSSQFTFGTGVGISERFSVNVGAAVYTERFGLDQAVSGDVLQQALAAIAADLHSLDGRPEPAAVVGMGGAITNITAVSLEMASYDSDRVQGSTLTRAEIERQIDLYSSRSADERRTIVGLQPKRAEVILAGACIVRTILDKLGADRLTVSDRGLRHGLLVERFSLPTS